MMRLVNKKIQENMCAICGNVSDNGIIINGNLVCPCCEVDIANILPTDDDYDSYVKKIKNILK